MLLRSLQRNTIGTRRPPPARPAPVVVREYRKGALPPAQAPATPAELVQPLHTFEPGYMTKTLNTMDSRPEPAREHDGYLHVSDLIGMCARQKVLTLTSDGPQAPSKVTGGHRVMWKLGRAAEAHVRDSFIQARDYHGILGRWVCACEVTEYEGLYDPGRARCSYCRTFPRNYKELVLRDHEAHIKGSPDLPYFAVGQDGAIVVTEIKSMNGEDFKALEAPLADHVFQGACYRRIFKLNGAVVMPVVVVLYVTKLFKYGSPYKEYHVDVSGPEWEAALDTTWDVAREVKRGVESGDLPPRRLCASATDSLAKKCPCLVSCFGRSR